MSTSEVLGVVVLARHGDRQGFYQDPATYTASNTAITSLGERQEFELGSLLRSLYLNSTSPTYIGTSQLFNQSQVQIRADAGGEGGVIFDSAVAMTQGLWPATPMMNTTLANGTNVVSPLGGYQYVPIESVEPDQDVSLEGFTSCNTLNSHTTAFYNSPDFLERSNQNAAFLNELSSYLDGRNVSLQNMWNVFDYMNVQSIHNATFAKRLPNGYLAQARDLANYHEYGIFSDSDFSGIGNVAARTMLPSLMKAVKRIANTTDPLKLHYSAISYKPFVSLLNMTGVVQNGQLPAAFVNYAGAVVLEIRQSPGKEPTIRFNFKNGTDDAAFNTYTMSFSGANGAQDVPLTNFVSAFSPAAINTTIQWCNICAQNTSRGCDELLGAAASSATSVPTGHHDRISPVGAGFLGAGLTLAVMSIALAGLMILGLLSCGRRSRTSNTYSHRQSDQSSEQTSSVVDEKHA